MLLAVAAVYSRAPPGAPILPILHRLRAARLLCYPAVLAIIAIVSAALLCAYVGVPVLCAPAAAAQRQPGSQRQQHQHACKAAHTSSMTASQPYATRYHLLTC